MPFRIQNLGLRKFQILNNTHQLWEINAKALLSQIQLLEENIVLFAIFRDDLNFSEKFFSEVKNIQWGLVVSNFCSITVSFQFQKETLQIHHYSRFKR
jgi:hypothetical protein